MTARINMSEMGANLDIGGRHLELTHDEAESLRDAAAVSAATAAPMRDLSLVPERALRTGKTVALRRAEARLLARLVADQDARALSHLRATLDELVNLRADG